MRRLRYSADMRVKSNLPAILGAVIAPLLLPAQALESGTHGIAPANMDTLVRPGDDFNEYSNGNWIKRTEIPPDRGRIGVFTTLRDESDKRTAGLIDEAAEANAPAG